MRRGSARYHLTAMPAPGDLGGAPPVSLEAFRASLADLAWATETVDAVLLLDDLEQRESFLSGESPDVSPGVLTAEQARNEAPLPEILEAGQADAGTGPRDADRLWGTYFRYVAGLSRRVGCPFLGDWVGFEVGLRNRLAVARAERLGLPSESYLVTPELESPDADVAHIVNEWASAADPLAGWWVLIRARWQWTDRHDAWFSFRVDELAAYAVRLMLLHQARRLTAFEDERSTLRAAGAGEREVGNR